MKLISLFKPSRVFKRLYSTNEEIVASCKEYTMWSWSAQKSVDPIVMSKAKGIYFWDASGKKYIDFNSQLMCSNIGHQHPKVLQAIKDQCDELAYAGPSIATRVRAEMGPLLAKHTPGNLNRFFFTLGGSEANENALKLAKFYTKKHKIITRYKSYHGATHGSIMLTGDPRRWPNESGAPMGNIIRVFDPYQYRSLLYQDGMSQKEFSSICLKQLEETILYENPDNIAAMFLETVTGTNGIIPPPDGYLQGLQQLLKKYGILMICDEVMCGLGRTGRWFAVDHWDVIPDIITMAKGVTSAYLPLGVVAMKPEIAAAFDNTVYSGGLTYSGHPLCLAAGVATLKVLEEEDIVGNAQRMGYRMKRHLQQLQDSYQCVGDIRCLGLFGGIELVSDRNTKAKLGASDLALVMKSLKEDGLLTYMAGNVLMCNPPLIIDEEQLDQSFEIISRALRLIG